MELTPPSPLIKDQTQTKRKTSSASMVEVVLLVIVIVLFYWFVVRPKQAQISSQAAQLASLQTNLSSVNSDSQDIKKLIGQLQGDPQDVSRLDQALPLQEKDTRLQLLIQTLGQDAGVTLNSVDISSNGSAIVAGDKQLLADPFGVQRALQTVPVNVVANGTFDQLMDFLQKIEDNAEVFNLNGLDLQAAQGQTLNMSLNLNAYYFTPQAGSQ